MIGDETPEDVVQVNARTLKLAMERGSVRVVSGVLKDSAFPDVTDAVEPEAGAVFAAAREWLREAAAFEEANGAGSRLDRSHPWNVDNMPMIERWRARHGLGV